MRAGNSQGGGARRALRSEATDQSYAGCMYVYPEEYVCEDALYVCRFRRRKGGVCGPIKLAFAAPPPGTGSSTGALENDEGDDPSFPLHQSLRPGRPSEGSQRDTGLSDCHQNRSGGYSKTRRRKGRGSQWGEMADYWTLCVPSACLLSLLHKETMRAHRSEGHRRLAE